MTFVSRALLLLLLLPASAAVATAVNIVILLRVLAEWWHTINNERPQQLPQPIVSNWCFNWCPTDRCPISGASSILLSPCWFASGLFSLSLSSCCCWPVSVMLRPTRNPQKKPVWTKSERATKDGGHSRNRLIPGLICNIAWDNPRLQWMIVVFCTVTSISSRNIHRCDTWISRMYSMAQYKSSNGFSI